MEIVPLREFARRVGVSLTAIQKGVKSGRITAITDDAGKVAGIDYATQATAWVENSKAPQRKPHNPAGGRPRKDGSPAQPSREGEVVDRLEVQARGGALKRSEKTPPPAGQMTMAEVQRARELVKLQIDNLKLKEAQGELVNAAEVKRQGYALGQALIADLYNMPERLADDFAGMSDPNAIHRLWVEEIDNAIAKFRSQYGC